MNAKMQGSDRTNKHATLYMHTDMFERVYQVHSIPLVE